MISRPPTILAFDTSTEVFHAVLDGPEGTWEIEEHSGLRHAEQIAVAAEELLRHCPLTEIDVVCYARGPGSFTGLRIGASFCKGLCAGDGGPALISVPTLPAMAAAWKPAATAHDAAGGTVPLLLPCIDGRKQRFFIQVCAADGTPVSDVVDARREDVFALLDRMHTTVCEVTVVGPHAERFREFIGEPGLRTTGTGGCGHGLITTARAAAAAGIYDDPEQGPEYYRVSQAEEGR